MNLNLWQIWLTDQSYLRIRLKVAINFNDTVSTSQIWEQFFSNLIFLNFIIWTLEIWNLVKKLSKIWPKNRIGTFGMPWWWIWSYRSAILWMLNSFIFDFACCPRLRQVHNYQSSDNFLWCRETEAYMGIKNGNTFFSEDCQRCRSGVESVVNCLPRK